MKINFKFNCYFGTPWRSNLKFLLICTLSVIFLSGCSDTKQFEAQTSKERFDKVMEQSANFCIKKGYRGHEPEYRGCVIETASKTFNRINFLKSSG